MGSVGNCCRLNVCFEEMVIGWIKDRRRRVWFV